LCKDDLNLNFDINVITKLDYSNKNTVFEVLQNKGGSSKEHKEGVIWRLDYDIVYNTYISSELDVVSRSIVFKYETTQIRDNRSKIEKAIFNELQIRLKNRPIKLKSVTMSNLDYPAVITKALEQAKQRQIERDQERHKQELRLLKLENERIATLKEIDVRRQEVEQMPHILKKYNLL